jgi:hypothetical protein
LPATWARYRDVMSSGVPSAVTASRDMERMSSSGRADSGPRSNARGGNARDHRLSHLPPIPQEADMTRILVTTEPYDGADADATVTLNEHVATNDLASGHVAAQLVERIGWALADAERAEDRTRLHAI